MQQQKNTSNRKNYLKISWDYQGHRQETACYKAKKEFIKDKKQVVKSIQ